MSENVTTQAPATDNVAPVVNLRAAKRSQTAARKAAKATHPAAAAKASTVKAPAKKAAPAKPTVYALDCVGPMPTGDAKKTPRKTPVVTGPKLRWKKDEATGRLTSTAGDLQYVVEPAGEKWHAVILSSGKKVTLVEGVSAGVAYQAALKHKKGE